MQFGEIHRTAPELRISDWIDEAGNARIGVVFLATSSSVFLLAKTVGVNGFVATFVAGMAFYNTYRHDPHLIQEIMHGIGQIILMVGFVIFGAFLLPAGLAHVSLGAVTLALLFLTIVRIGSIWLSQICRNQNAKRKADTGLVWPASHDCRTANPAAWRVFHGLGKTIWNQGRMRSACAMRKLMHSAFRWTDAAKGAGPSMAPQINIVSRPLPACLLTHAFPCARKATCVHTKAQQIFFSKAARRECARIIPVYRETSSPMPTANKTARPVGVWAKPSQKSEKSSV